LRNVTRIDAALNEARRTLKPGGRFLCLEFTPLITPFLQPLYDLYSFHIVPRLGRMVAGDREAYTYLVESIRRFPRQSELCETIGRAGLDQVRFRNLTGGVAALHSAWRL
jgi:demethylmenaquinone methyltransferase/2-methoxy-6-polyprenyl-1,4-benzoquinol methylase